MMKVYRPKPLVLAMGTILSGLLALQPVIADTVSPGSVHAQKITKEAVSDARQATANKKAEFSREAVDALKATEEAIGLLENGKKTEAIKKLELASGKLEIAMAADPSLKLVPVAVNVVTHDLITTPKAVKADLRKVEEYLDDGNVQGARVLLNRLRSDITTEYTYLPLETYPDAIKRAVKEITADESKKARETLITAMDSMVEEAIVTPLPVVLAEGAIKEAEAVQTSDKDESLRDLEYAAGQIETARRLGYFYNDKADYTKLRKSVADLQQAVSGKSKTAKLFDDIKHSMSNLLHKFNGGKS